MTTTNYTLSTTEKLRNAELGDLVSLLKSQSELKYDVVVSASALHYQRGLIMIDGGATIITDDGVDTTFALLRPTKGCERQVGEKMGIPSKYMEKMRDDAIVRAARNAEAESGEGDMTIGAELGIDDAAWLLDHNVNHWLEADPSKTYLVRGFRTDDPNEIGVARAFLSDRFAMIDHMDVLVAALDGVKRSGATIEIDRCDLTESKMHVRFTAPEVQTLAPLWLKGYRSPFAEDGNGGALQRARARYTEAHLGVRAGDEPIVYAGFVLQNSETGGGTFTLAPQVIVQWCKNGATIAADALTRVHLGAKLDEGIVQFSADTQATALELVTKKARDAVATFLDGDYLRKVVATIEEQCGAPIGEPTKIVERVGKQFGFRPEEQEAILSAFIASGQTTAGGVMQAVTAVAQTLDDADRAAEFEEKAIDVLAFAAKQ